jgi:hypothetical protein
LQDSEASNLEILQYQNQRRTRNRFLFNDLVVFHGRLHHPGESDLCADRGT